MYYVPLCSRNMDAAAIHTLKHPPSYSYPPSSIAPLKPLAAAPVLLLLLFTFSLLRTLRLLRPQFPFFILLLRVYPCRLFPVPSVLHPSVRAAVNVKTNPIEVRTRTITYPSLSFSSHNNILTGILLP